MADYMINPFNMFRNLLIGIAEQKIQKMKNQMIPHFLVLVSASVIMILGYGIIAVPTGIVTAAIAKSSTKVSTQACKSCSKEGHDPDASHCKFCGVKLND